MNREDFTEFSGSLTFNTIKFNHDAIPKPDTLVICMTRGERRIADELRKSFGGFKRVIIDVDGEQHEFRADSFIGLLESYEHAIGWHELFGTPERAARTLSTMQRCELGIIGNCDDCDLPDACRVRDGDYDALLEWLGGDA